MTEPTDAEIIALADETRTAEGGANGYILPISFCRAVLAKWGAPVQAAPAAVAVPTFEDFCKRHGLDPKKMDGHGGMWARVALDECRAITTQPAPVRETPADLPPLPDPDLLDVGTKPEDIKNFLRGYATEYAKAALAAHKQGANHD